MLLGVSWFASANHEVRSEDAAAPIGMAGGAAAVVADGAALALAGRGGCDRFAGPAVHGDAVVFLKEALLGVVAEAVMRGMDGTTVAILLPREAESDRNDDENDDPEDRALPPDLGHGV